MLNKPKFHLIKNTKYALDGLKDIIFNEKSFQIEIILFFIVSVIIFYTQFSFVCKTILFLSMFLPIIAEIINTAIERVVDMYTKEYNILAKKAKDMGSLIVFMSFIVMILIWIATIYYEFYIFKI